jgi:hypothetical protein
MAGFAALNLLNCGKLENRSTWVLLSHYVDQTTLALSTNHNNNKIIVNTKNQYIF